MKKLVITAALLGSTTLMAPSAFANGNSIHLSDVLDFVNGCETLCATDRADIKQNLTGVQWSLNQIVDIDDAQDIVQSAVNAGNLVSVEDLNIDLGTVIQQASVKQDAHNKIDGGWNSDFDDLSQAATNVVNSITGGTAWNINQSVTNAQTATNAIYGGSGGYDAEDVADWDDDGVMTQTAVNASNLVDLTSLKNDIVQASNASQSASNVATFDSEIQFHGWWPTLVTPNVYDLGQSATNVTNSVTVSNILLGSSNYGGCACDFEISQQAYANQSATNLLSTMGDVSNIAQRATNVANSISVPTVD